LVVVHERSEPSRTADHEQTMKWLRIPKKLGRLVRRTTDRVPLSWRGSLVALFAGLALWFYGFGALDLVLFVIGIAGIVLVVLSSLVTGGAALYLGRRVPDASADVQRLEAGSAIRTGFNVPALAKLPLVKIHWQWVQPAGVKSRIRLTGNRLTEEVVATHRCQVTGTRRRFTVHDAFGLSRVAWEREDPGSLTILPNVGGLRNMPVVQSMAAAEGMAHPIGAPEGDRMEIRRYAPGDSMRNIMWKTFARTRQLNVRMPEPSIDRSRKTVAYLIAGPDDEAAAAAARAALEAGALGEQWLFGADGTSDPTSRLDPALEAIARSGSLSSNGDPPPFAGPRSDNGKQTALGQRLRPTAASKKPPSGLRTFLSHARLEGEVHCIVFAPARPGRWTSEALEAARSYPGAVSFVLGTDGVVRTSPPPLWRRLLFTEEAVAGTPAEELAAVLRILASAGCPALVIDRVSGRSYGRAHQRALGGRG